jgi:hypothetical protein
VQNGPNIAFDVPANGMDVVFQWNSTTRELRVVVGGIHGDLTKAQAYWLTSDTIAWNVPTDTAVALFADPDGALTLDGPGIVAGTNTQSWTLTHDPAGLPPALREKYPHLASLAVFKLPADAVAAAAQSLKGQVAIGAVRGIQGVDATSLQFPGVLDDLYSAKAGPVTLGPSFRHGQATLRVWAPTARDLSLRVYADSSTSSFTTHPMTLDPASGIWSFTAASASVYGKYYLYEAQVFVRSTNKVETNLVTDLTRFRWRATARAAISFRSRIPGCNPVAGTSCTSPISHRRKTSCCTNCTCGTSAPPMPRFPGTNVARTRRSRRSARMV